MDAARIAPKRFIPLADLEDMRRAGTEFAPALIKNEIGKNLKSMKKEINNTKEYYAIQAPTGKIYDADGSTLLWDFNMPAGHIITLAGTDKWDDHANAMPHIDIRTWCGMIADAIGLENIHSFEAVASPDVINDLIANTNFTDLVKTQIGVQLALEGKLEKLAGVNIKEYRGDYEDEGGVKQNLFPAGYFRLGAVTDDLTEEYYAPPVKNVPGGVGSGGIPPEIAVSFEWVEDPAGVWLYAESRPLPAVHDSQVFVSAKVK